MSKYLLLLILVLPITLTAQKKQEINWMSWEEAIAAREKFFAEKADSIKARQVVPKKIFIDLYTSWCGWCKKMDKTTFKDPNVIAYMNRHYYAVKFNAETHDTISYDGHKFFNQSPPGKKGTHTLALSLLDGQMSYPSYVIMDENVHRAHIIPGYKNAFDLFGILNFFGSNNYLTYKNYVEKTAEQAKSRQKQVGGQ